MYHANQSLAQRYLRCNADSMSSMLNSKRNATKFQQTDKKYFFGQKHLGATTVKVDIFLFNSALASYGVLLKRKISPLGMCSKQMPVHQSSISSQLETSAARAY